ncbi:MULTISPECIES: hypothetical protein [Roseomonadaceae]|uniref:Uncharacterized protein n=1 Tax=Falsiroseomonas oleicola TaxID=2801474 RepID=A0ABS6H6M0_9PROT|nr:hypothetical protein [Roseomonas oleicola]MBU8544320.1 hypothetical protein [Roseomonas oleicola]
MQHRESVPDDHVPGSGMLRIEAGASLPFDLFAAADVELLCGAARRSPVPGLRHQQEALRLSDTAIAFVMERRRRDMTDREKVELMSRMAKLAEELHGFMRRSDIADLWDPDIGHLPAIQLAMDAPHDAEFWRRKDAAKEARYLIGGDSDPQRFLWILQVAATEQARRSTFPSRRGPERQTARHVFVSRVLHAYTAMTGQAPGIGPANGGTRKAGPAARFVAEVCRLMRARLTHHEREVDPGIDGLLASGEAEHVAGQWVSEALRHRTREEQLLAQLRGGPRGSAT